ncbi:11770_t:CDS:2, partial [Gigaspora margarita]
VDEYKYWPKEKMNKPRDQFEYDEWCRVGRYLDNAVIGQNWEAVAKAREIVATRAFMLRVAKREGWSVAAEIRDSSDDDPMDAYFQDKLISARQLAKNKRSKVENSAGTSGTVVASLLVGFGNLATNQTVQWPVFQQPIQQQFQPVQSSLAPNLTPFQSIQPTFGLNVTPGYGNVMPDQSPYQQQYRKRGHIAWDCPQKKSGQSFRRAESGRKSRREKSGEKDSFRIIKEVLEGGYKTRGTSDGMVGERDTTFSKRREIVSTNEGAETDRVYRGRVEMGGARIGKADEDGSDLWFDSGYGKRGGRGAGRENREGERGAKQGGEFSNDSSKKIGIIGRENSEFCMGVSAGTSEVHGILRYNRCGKSEKMEIGQKCAVNEQGVRGCEMVEEKPGEMEWQTGVEAGSSKSGVCGCIDDRMVWDLYGIQGSRELATTVQCGRNSAVGKFGDNESPGVVCRSVEALLGDLVHRQQNGVEDSGVWGKLPVAKRHCK